MTTLSRRTIELNVTPCSKKAAFDKKKEEDRVAAEAEAKKNEDKKEDGTF